ncbi:MAG: hypothetical protein GY835_20130 [bacterium]|nr:hypothetical protein [bacterium]
MSRHTKTCLPLLIVTLLHLAVGAGATKFSADFATKGTGARPLAMGDTFTAVADDVNVLFYNPGALALLPGQGLSMMHSERFGGLVQVDHAAYHKKVVLYGREAGLGISILRVGVDNIRFTGSPEDHGWEPDFDGDVFGPEDYEELNIDPSLFSTVTNQNLCFLGVYSSQVRNWALGGAIKVLYQSVGEFNSFGFGLDAGVLSPRFGPGLRAGLKLQDVLGTYLAWNTGVSEFVPPSLRPGLSWIGANDNQKVSLLLAADAEIHFERYGDAAAFNMGVMSIDPHLGLELWLVNAVALRMGYDRNAWTAGGGLRLAGNHQMLPWEFLDDLSLDYAFGNHEDLEGSHRLGLAVRF